MNTKQQISSYNIVDGRRVPIANSINETKYGREYSRLDAPHGYKKRVKFPDDSSEDCTVYVMQGYSGKERYATVSKPTSDPLVAYRCVRLTRN
jgi:hypothetical protein